MATCPKCKHAAPADDFKTMFGECECPACGHLFDPPAEEVEESD